MISWICILLTQRCVHKSCKNGNNKEQTCLTAGFKKIVSADTCWQGTVVLSNCELCEMKRVERRLWTGALSMYQQLTKEQRVDTADQTSPYHYLCDRSIQRFWTIYSLMTSPRGSGWWVFGRTKVLGLHIWRENGSLWWRQDEVSWIFRKRLLAEDLWVIF